jgi:uncharacterized protein YndB with AHSA1/START domain
MRTTHPDSTHERRPDGTHVLRWERRLAHPVDRVWRAVTEPADLVGWLADADVDLRAGGRVQLRWLNSGEAGAVATGTVALVDPPRLVEYDTDIHGTLRFELAPDGEQATRLTFTVIHPDLDDGGLDLVRPGWHVHLEHLEDALDGRPIDWPRWAHEHRPRWEELREQYRAQAASRA